MSSPPPPLHPLQWQVQCPEGCGLGRGRLNELRSFPPVRPWGSILLILRWQCCLSEGRALIAAFVRGGGCVVLLLFSPSLCKTFLIPWEGLLYLRSRKKERKVVNETHHQWTKTNHFVAWRGLGWVPVSSNQVVFHYTGGLQDLPPYACSY